MQFLHIIDFKEPKEITIISVMKLMKMAKKWKKLTGINGRKRIKINGGGAYSSVAEKGHFVVYSADGKRFMFPLEYLQNDIFKELLRVAEEEFGLPRDGPITFPCGAILLDCIVGSIQQQNNSEDLEKALVRSMASNCSSLSLNSRQEPTNQKLLICSF